MSSTNLPEGLRLSLPQAWSFIYRPRRYYAWLRRRYGDVVTLYAPHATLVMTLTSEGARQILTANPDGYDAFQKQAFTGLAGTGSLFVLDGARHRRERRLLLPAFHAKYVLSYGQAIVKIVHLHTDVWQPSEHLRAYDVMRDLSRDVILRVVLGLEHGPMLDEGRKVLGRVLSAAHPLLEYVPKFQAWWFPPWLSFQSAKHDFSNFVTRCLAERRTHDDNSDDVLGLLLAAQYDDGMSMSDDEILDELYTILLPGHATTSVALSWALYELIRHPDVLKRLREELDALGQDTSPDLIVKQPYLRAVCNETLRLHTIVTEVARLTRRPCQLFGYLIPAGIGLGVSISAIHQDPVLYPEPDQFRPERFIERSYSPFEFLPFGGGHRRCLGAALSDYEMRIALAMIVTRWDLELVGKEREIRHHLGMGPKHGVPIKIKGPC